MTASLRIATAAIFMLAAAPVFAQGGGTYQGTAGFNGVNPREIAQKQREAQMSVGNAAPQPPAQPQMPSNAPPAVQPPQSPVAAQPPALPDSVPPVMHDASAPAAPAAPVAPGTVPAAAEAPAVQDPCAAYMNSYEVYAVCQDRLQKIQRMRDAKKKRTEDKSLYYQRLEESRMTPKELEQAKADKAAKAAEAEKAAAAASGAPAPAAAPAPAPEPVSTKKTFKGLREPN
jgi:hypothetical protein